MIKIIENGNVCSAKGYKAAGIAAGIKKNGARDLALVVSEVPAVAAGVFTQNVVKGHSLKKTMENIKGGVARAVLVNSGNANACVGEQGVEVADMMCDDLAKLLGCKSDEIIVNATGVIGQVIDKDKMKSGIADSVAALKLQGSDDPSVGGTNAVEAIMTTDLVKKQIAVQFELGGKTVTIGGIAKGSGMIHPNMATMIGIITTDASINHELLHVALVDATNTSFNRVSVDGDTSVCDMVVCLANGLAGNDSINAAGQDYELFSLALKTVCEYLARMMAKDGEGATKLVEINVNGAATAVDAYLVACTIAKSPLCKTAFFGEDANCGRIITAVGYSGAPINPNTIDIYLGNLKTFENGNALAFDEDKALEILKKPEIFVIVDLKMGSFSDRMWTCDFSYDYVKINASYRS
jgi:glutamate N-acetyltransferase/amino-acid N-acetyltransferase